MPLIKLDKKSFFPTRIIQHTLSLSYQSGIEIMEPTWCERKIR